jgi:predicted DNA-binding protein (UPF0251 family)
MVAGMLGVEDAEALELVAMFLLKYQDAPDKSEFVREALRRALIEPDKIAKRTR